MDSVRSTWQDVALLVAGALISTLAGRYLLGARADALVIPVIVVSLLLILLGSGLLPRFVPAFNRWRGAGRWPFHPSVGILFDMGWNPNNQETYTWTDVSPEEWRDLVQAYLRERHKNARIEFITRDSAFERFTIIINPYGGVYPESDLENYKVLRKVMDYVARGGMFANIADVPGYWAYNEVLRRRIEVTPPVYTSVPVPGGSVIQTIRPYALTPFPQRLGLRILGVEGTPLATWQVRVPGQGHPQQVTVHRVAVVESKVRSVVNTQPLHVGTAQEEVSPVLRVEFGQGQFLLCLIPHDLPPNGGVRQLVASEVASIVARQT